MNDLFDTLEIIDMVCDEIIQQKMTLRCIEEIDNIASKTTDPVARESLLKFKVDISQKFLRVK